MKDLIPTKKQWKDWSLPSKLTAIGTLVGVLSLAIYFIEKSSSILSGFDIPKFKEDVLLVIEFENKKNESVSFFGRGETFYWFPGGGEYINYAYEAIGSNDNQINLSSIVVPSKSKKRVVVKLLPRDIARGYLEQGHMTLSLFFRYLDGGTISSPTVGFSRSNLKNAFIPVVINENES